MHGWFSTKVRGMDDHDAGYHQGRDDGSPIEFVATIDADDLDRARRATPRCRSRSPARSLRPHSPRGRLTVVDGEFTLFCLDPHRAETSYMRYEILLPAEDGQRFLFQGQKTLHHGAPLDAWTSTTTLAVTARVDGGNVLGVRCAPHRLGDLAPPGHTIRVTRSGVSLAAKGLARFVGRFARELLTSYGGIAGAWSVRRASGAPSGRALRLHTPEVVYASGGAWGIRRCHMLPRLTRYRGGSKGPVVLAPGFGMSTEAFVTDTIDTNLTEYLSEHGYDVWLFDLRWSPDLQSPRDPFFDRRRRHRRLADPVSRSAGCTGADAFR